MAATVRRDLKEPVTPVERSHEERGTFRWRRFLLLTYLVVTASTAQLCLMTQDEIRERKLREAQETRNRLRSANQEQQVAGSTGKYRDQKPSPTVIPATIDRDLEPSKRPPTGGWAMRISDCPHSIEQRAFRENAYLEWMTCLSCGARWSRKTGQDDIQVKMGLTIDQPQVTSPSKMCINDATATDGKQNGDILRMQSVSSVQKSGAHISYYGITCFTVCALVFSSSAHGGAGDGTGLRFSRIGRELHNAGCFSRTSCITTGTTIPTGTATASFVFWHHGSGSTTGDRPNVSRPTAKDQGEQGSSDLARHNAEDLNNTGVLQSVRVWTDKTDDNADTWEAAIRHFNKVSVSSCFLMEIDKGCLQPSVFDDSIFREYIGSLVKNAAGIWEPAVKTQCQSKPLSGVRKKSMAGFVM